MVLFAVVRLVPADATHSIQDNASKSLKRYTANPLAYHPFQRMDADLVQDTWQHADALRELRRSAGGLSVERAAARIDVSRSTWNAWETGKQRPTHDSLRLIVEAFGCPPELVWYEPPRGWDLVPSAWFQECVDAQEQRAATRHAEVLAAIERMRGDLLHAGFTTP